MELVITVFIFFSIFFPLSAFVCFVFYFRYFNKRMNEVLLKKPLVESSLRLFSSLNYSRYQQVHLNKHILIYHFQPKDQ